MSAARRAREEKNKNLVNQLQDFANDSIIFFNKCAKPDKNGMLYCFDNGALTLICRIHEDLASLRHGIFGNWVYWIYH